MRVHTGQPRLTTMSNPSESQGSFFMKILSRKVCALCCLYTLYRWYRLYSLYTLYTVLGAFAGQAPGLNNQSWVEKLNFCSKGKKQCLVVQNSWHHSCFGVKVSRSFPLSVSLSRTKLERVHKKYKYQNTKIRVSRVGQSNKVNRELHVFALGLF